MSAKRASWFICSDQLKHGKPWRTIHLRRGIVTSNPPPPPESAYARLPFRRLISLHGDDASKYLQGLISANVPSPSKNRPAGFYSAFLNAQGRVLHDVFIYPTKPAEQDSGFLIEVDADEVQSLYKHLKRFRLRAKIALRIVDEGELNIWSAWGPGLQLQEEGVIDSRVPLHGSHSTMGSRLIISGNEGPNWGAQEVSCASYDVRRIGLGVPEGQREILKETALPQESNIDYMGGVDFRKGCYLGQELTIRTHHTGVVRKRILPVQLYRASETIPDSLSYKANSDLQLPPSGANISRADKKGRSAGRWLTGVGNIGLALCRLEVMTDTVLTGEGVQRGENDQFKITLDGQEGADNHEIRVKAFVPYWHSIRAEEQRVQRPNG